MTKKNIQVKEIKLFNDYNHPNPENPEIEDDKQIIDVINDNQPLKELFPIVGIGASAGGLDALESFFSNTIPNSEIAWVIVMHLDPTRESILNEILKKYTQMPVLQVEDNMEIKPDCVYVIPPNRDIALKNNRLLLSEPTAPRGLRLPIDFFFRSVSEDQRDRAIGVILSGAGTDGTLGAREIKGVGGMIIVQEPETAKYNGMPNSVINTTVVDYILPPDKIPKQLIEYVQKNISYRITKPDAPSKDNIDYINQIFNLILTQTGHDFSAYKMNTLIRRIERRMAINQITIVSNYIQKIREDPNELRTLTKELIIGVTNFFRDKEAFRFFEDKVIPTLFQNRKPMETLRIWIPGCSTGEEAYSVAIIIQEYIENVKQNYKYQIFATDIDETAIEKARLGLFPENISVDVSQERLQHFFIEEKNFYQVIKSIRDKIVFAVQNIIYDPPFSKLDLISCRNLLIYLIPEIQKGLSSLFNFSLNEGGILFLGSSESIGEFKNNFEVINQKWKIFQKKGIKPFYKEFISPFPPLIELPGKTTVMEFSKVKEKFDYRKFIERKLIEQFAPASVIINHKNEILYIIGRTGKFLEPSTGEAKMNVTEMAREDLKFELGKAIRIATVEKREYRREGLKIRSNGDFTYINLIVNPMSEPPEMSGLILVSFEELIPKEPKLADNLIKEPLNDSSIKLIKQLEGELSSTKQYLQSVIEGYDTASEELKSANEELQSANEELQSTNEELQTSKEELQSLNEELNTVNVELQSKINEVSIVNTDLNNLLSATEIGTIFLDNRLNILRFSASITPILNLIPTDIGRPLHHISSNLQYENLIKDAEDVLRTLIPKQIDVQTIENKWFSTRLIPYRTLENIINGVVITFVDITESKRIVKELRKSEEKYRNIVENAIEGVWVIDTNANTTFVNPQMAKMLGYSPNEMIGKSLFQFITDSKKYNVKEIFDKREKNIGGEQEIEFLCKNGLNIYTRLNISPLYKDDGSLIGVIAFITDITDRKKVEVMLFESEKKYREAFKMAELYKDLFTHDISNILQSIGTPIELLLKYQFPKGFSKDMGNIFELIKGIYTQFSRASQLISNIRKLSNIDVNINSLKKVNIIEILNNSIQNYKNVYSQKVNNIKLDLAFNEIYIKADDFLRDVFDNILNNATKHNKSSIIEIQVKVNKLLENNVSYVKCEFIDNGVGIPDSLKHRIFSEPVKSLNGSGMGIGLTLVSKIISRYKGKISIEDCVSGDYTKGTNFILLIPEDL